MKTIIAGGRNIVGVLADELVAKAVSSSGFTITEVVSGRARGIDSAGERWAAKNNIPLKTFAADWSNNGKAAGPIRNGEMAAYADALIAVWDGQSRGTANMIKQARGRGLSVYVYRTDE